MSEYTLKELVRNNCACCSDDRYCEDCEIDKQMALAVKEWLLQFRKKTMEIIHSNPPDSNTNFLYIPIVTFIDRTLIPALDVPNLMQKEEQK